MHAVDLRCSWQFYHYFPLPFHLEGAACVGGCDHLGVLWTSPAFSGRLSGLFWTYSVKSDACNFLHWSLQGWSHSIPRIQSMLKIGHWVIQVTITVVTWTHSKKTWGWLYYRGLYPKILPFFFFLLWKWLPTFNTEGTPCQNPVFLNSRTNTPSNCISLNLNSNLFNYIKSNHEYPFKNCSNIVALTLILSIHNWKLTYKCINL